MHGYVKICFVLSTDVHVYYIHVWVLMGHRKCNTYVNETDGIVN